MTDQQLLEKAARAAGIELIWSYDGNMCWLDNEMTGCCNNDEPWNPLENDGDAFRLMAALNLNLGFDGTDQGVEVAVMGVWDGGPDETCEVFEGNDATAAMRRAIVRAAAAMEDSHD